MNVNLRFTFGSIFNNIVNPRFDFGGGISSCASSQQARGSVRPRVVSSCRSAAIVMSPLAVTVTLEPRLDEVQRDRVPVAECHRSQSGGYSRVWPGGDSRNAGGTVG